MSNPNRHVRVCATCKLRHDHRMACRSSVMVVLPDHGQYRLYRTSDRLVTVTLYDTPEAARLAWLERNTGAWRTP
jgi:hypothetical protein